MLVCMIGAWGIQWLRSHSASTERQAARFIEEAVKGNEEGNWLGKFSVDGIEKMLSLDAHGKGTRCV